MFCYSRLLDACELKYNLLQKTPRQFLCMCLTQVTRGIYRPYIAHPMTDTLTAAGLRETAQSAIQYSEAFIKMRPATKPFWPEHYVDIQYKHTQCGYTFCGLECYDVIDFIYI